MRRLNSDLLEGLISAGFFSKQELQAVLKVAGRRDHYVEELLINMGYVEEADLLNFQANFYRAQFISSQKLSTVAVDKALLKLVPQKLAERLIVFPILFSQPKQSLTILTVQPDDLDIIKEVQFAARVHDVKALIARESAIQAAISKHYYGKENAFNEGTMQLSYKRALADQEKQVERFERAIERKSSVSVPPISSRDDSLDMVLERSQQSVAHRTAEPALIEEDGSSDAETNSWIEGRSRFSPSVAQSQRASAQRAMTTSRSEPASGSAPKIESIAFQDYLETLKIFVALLENNRGDLRGHSILMARICQRLCERIDLSVTESNHVIAAAYLHDIGKVSAYHLTALNVAQFDGHKNQANNAYLKPVRFLESARLPVATKTILEHMYERFDGMGFPDRLSGKDIPLGARVMAIVDTYTDLTVHERNPYRKKLTPVEACEVLTRFSNTIFDPSLVDVFKLVVLGDDLRARLLAIKWRALLIDPDPEETTVLELSLLERGFDVTIARNSSDIETILGRAEYDLVICEVDLAPVDGFTLLQKIRAGKTGDIPFVFLTKRSGSDMVKRGFELGALDYITKPTSPDVVALKLSQILEGASRKREHRGVSGSLEEMNLSDVVQVLFHGRKSGKLMIVSGSKRGEVHFSEGQVVDAIFGDKEREEAFYEMLCLASGSFELDFNFRPAERRIRVSPESLLLEGMRRLDEAGR
ncbi:MAG: DUF4388 domain-containing protein [Deltaproteobacteria bacterium]|nr:DUF4388 domain-containing protein [Deltaproteobacteria bacterium]